MTLHSNFKLTLTYSHVVFEDNTEFFTLPGFQTIFHRMTMAKSGKYYSEKRAKFVQLQEERAVIALGFHLARKRLKLLQTSVNILYDTCCQNSLLMRVVHDDMLARMLV